MAEVKSHVVVCYDEDFKYVLATRTLFTAVEANRYASTLPAGRGARVIPVTDYLVECEGWQTFEEPRAKIGPRPATRVEVRRDYVGHGYRVKISRTGHVQLRIGGGKWLDGRWVSEYVFEDGKVHLK